MRKNISAIFIGASAGGISAVQRLLMQIVNNRQVPIVVVQHLPQYAKLNPSLIYGQDSQNVVFTEANDKMHLECGHVYFAPPGYHLLVEKDYSFSLSQDDPVNFARPSIDVLFESAAIAYRERACGILLTGTNNDGALGLQTIHLLKGLTIVQDPASAEFPSMPQSAIDLFKPNYVASIPKIPAILEGFDKGEAL